MWVPDKDEGIDILIGIVGFFTAVFLVVTVITELTGADALGWAITLLVLVLALVALVRIRRRIHAPTTSNNPKGGVR